MRVALPLLALALLMILPPFAPQTSANDAAQWLADGTLALGRWAPLAWIGAYVVVIPLLVPSAVLSVGAGFLFGLSGGLVTASLGGTVGALAAFLIGRGWLHRRSQPYLARWPLAKALHDAVGRRGFHFVLLARLSPVLPSGALSYVLGLSNVRLGVFLWASWLGMLPITTAYVYAGSTLASLAEWERSEALSTWQLGLYAGGLLATLVLVVVLSQAARRQLLAEMDAPRETSAHERG